jgi:WD40 repeat protein
MTTLQDFGWRLVFSPDSSSLVAGTWDKGLRLWNVANGRLLATLRGQGHTGSILGLDLSADGKTLASGSGDTTIKLWDLRTTQEVATLRGHALPVTAVAFSLDSNLLATGSGDGTIRLWRAAPFAETDATGSARPQAASR